MGPGPRDRPLAGPPNSIFYAQAGSAKNAGRGRSILPAGRDPRMVVVAHAVAGLEIGRPGCPVPRGRARSVVTGPSLLTEAAGRAGWVHRRPTTKAIDPTTKAIDVLPDSIGRRSGAQPTTSPP